LQPWIVASGRPGDFNQAMMDLGATCCTPRSPCCEECPLRNDCVARREGRQAALPTRPPRKALPTRTAVAVLVRDEAGRVLLTQRAPDGLLGGLWELPNGASGGTPTARDAARVLRTATGMRVTRIEARGCFTHTFTHFKQVWHLFEAVGLSVIPTVDPRPSGARFATPQELPLTTLTRRVLDHLS
ncbi:MAG TPA: NUDIX domain-containing protein, partial [Kiritimatiellia bacterium]|nr:NUDIX domain-containing protein [Kiritimatiellia bacterium]